MTRDEVMKMPAGREIEEMVAEKVLACEYPKSPLMYSRNISAAWVVAEVLHISLVNSEDGWYAVVTEDVVHIGSIHRSKEVHGKHWALADTAPLAICKAALLAKMEVE